MDPFDQNQNMWVLSVGKGLYESFKELGQTNSNPFMWAHYMICEPMSSLTMTYFDPQKKPWLIAKPEFEANTHPPKKNNVLKPTMDYLKPIGDRHYIFKCLEMFLQIIRSSLIDSFFWSTRNSFQQSNKRKATRISTCSSNTRRHSFQRLLTSCLFSFFFYLSPLFCESFFLF